MRRGWRLNQCSGDSKWKEIKKTQLTVARVDVQVVSGVAMAAATSRSGEEEERSVFFFFYGDYFFNISKNKS
jgi:hypothetical protein